VQRTDYATCGLIVFVAAITAGNVQGFPKMGSDLLQISR
jgi:hypothetical protein